MYQPLFYASRAKIRRAHSLIQELDELESLQRKDLPFSINQEPHPEKTGLWRCVVRNCKPLPDEVPLILGDAIHNLRASLDLLACDLVRANNGDPSGVYFPFCQNGEDLESIIKRRKIERCSPDVIDLIRSIKPYKGGNDALRAIHDLDIADKHQLLIPTLTALSLPSIDLDFAADVYLTCDPDKCEMPVYDGAIILDEITDDKRYAFEDRWRSVIFVFGPDQPLAGEPISPTLHNFAKLVDGIVETFASHVLRGNPKI